MMWITLKENILLRKLIISDLKKIYIPGLIQVTQGYDYRSPCIMSIFSANIFLGAGFS